MVHELAPIDISKTDLPSLTEVAEDVRRTNRPRILRRADEDIAVISPVKKAVKRSPFQEKSQADIKAMLSTAGAWKDEDTDTLKATIYESRGISTRPRPEL